MLIQTAERRHRREIELAVPGARWPRNALDMWWRQARTSKEPERVALDVLDRWRRYATYELQGSLFSPQMLGFLEVTGANRFARVLDRVSVAALAAWDPYRKLRGNYTGAAFNAVRTSDSNAADYGFAGDTSDIAALLAHATSNTEVIATLYDQVNAWNLTALTTQRPTIVNAGALITQGSSGVPSLSFNGSSNRLGRADILGLASASPALTVACCTQLVALSASAAVFALGGNATNTQWGMLYNGTDTANVYSWQNGSHREFGVSGSVTAAARRFIFTRALSSVPSAYTASEDAGALSQSGISNGATALSLANSVTRIGCACTTADSLFCSMKLNMLIFFNSSALVQSDLDELDREMLVHT